MNRNRKLPAIDTVSIDNDHGAFCLTENLSQAHHRKQARNDHISKHKPGANRRKLVNVTCKNQG